MIGGMQEAEIVQEDRDLINNLTGQINEKLGHANCTYTVECVHNQVVAGTMKFFHLNASNGEKVSVCVFVPLGNDAPELKLWEHGHTQARNPN